jgi:hypothetical protein
MKRSGPWLAGVVTATLAGCSGGSTMSVSTALRSGAAPAALATAPATSFTPTQLYLVVKELELKKAAAPGTSSGTGPGSGPTGEVEEIEVGPFVLAIDLSSPGVKEAIPDVSIPDGTYAGVEFEIHRARAGEALNLTRTALGTPIEGFSMILEGTCPATGGGAPTTFTVASSEEIEQEYESPVVVDAKGQKNVTLAFDTSAWFTGPGGAALDPCTGDAAAQARIAANVRASLQAFSDDDRDGERD